MEILSLGEKIKRKRKSLNMTLKDLAKDRITPGQISLVESGRSNPSMDLLEYLAANLNTSVEYLMESEESQAEKISTYYEQVAESYLLSGDYENCQKYIEDAQYYADKYNLEYRKAKILILRGEIQSYKGEYENAQQTYLSANVIFVKNKDYEEIVNTFLKLATITIKLKAFYSASSYLKQAEGAYIDNNLCNDLLLGEIYYNMAKVFHIIEKTDQALEYAYKAEQKFDQIQNKKEYAKTLLALSEQYNKKGDLVNAVKYSTKTLEVYEEINKIEEISVIENNLGELFYNFEKIDESSRHFNKAKEIRISNNCDNLVETLINICNTQLKQKNVKECEATLSQINRILDPLDYEKRVKCNFIRFRLFNIKDMKNEAEEVLIETYNLGKESNNLRLIGEVCFFVAKYYSDKKEDGLASKYLKEGVEMFQQLGIIEK